MTQYDMSMNKYIYTSKNLCFIGCFSWMIMMIPCFTLNNGCFNKYPAKKMVVWSTRYIFTKENNLKLYIYPNLLSKTQPVQKCLGIFWAVQKGFGFQGEACTHQNALVAIPIHIYSIYIYMICILYICMFLQTSSSLVLSGCKTLGVPSFLASTSDYLNFQYINI